MAQSIFAAPTRSKSLVEFKAGKMLIRGNTVSADKRKGLVQLVQNPEDNLIHFKWKDRTAGTVETDLIIFPEEATFKRVKQCTTGRVYLLEWKTSARRMFFWMQEPSDDKDEEYCQKINQSINNPPLTSATAGAGPGANAGGAAAGLGGLGGLGALGNLDQNQLFQMMQSMRGGRTAAGISPNSAAPAATTPATTTGPVPVSSGGSTTASNAPASANSAMPSSPLPETRAPTSSSAQQNSSLSNSMLQNILSELGVQGGSPGSPAPRLAQRSDDTDLEHLLTPEAIQPLLDDPEVQRQLLPCLPEGHRNPEELQRLIHSPQFQQALQTLNAALQSGQDMMPLLGLPSNNAGGLQGVDALLRTLQEQARQRQGQHSQSSQPATTSTSSPSASGSAQMEIDETPSTNTDDSKSKDQDKKEEDKDKSQ